MIKVEKITSDKNRVRFKLIDDIEGFTNICLMSQEAYQILQLAVNDAEFKMKVYGYKPGDTND